MAELKAEAEKLKADGNKALQGGNADEAVQLYSQAIKCDPENAALFSNRSAAYCKSGKYMEALTDAETAVQLKPDWAKGYSRKGAALQFMNRYDEAMNAYMESLKFDPNNAAAKKSVEECKEQLSGPSGDGLMNPFADPKLFEKLEADSRTKEYLKDPSFRAIMQNLQKDPKMLGTYMQDTRVMSALGALLGVQLGTDMPTDMGSWDPETSESNGSSSAAEEKKEAKKTEEPMETENGESESKVSAEDKKAALAEKEKGNAAYKKKDFETALTHYGKAMEIDPTDITYRNNRAAVYFEQGEFDVCIKECNEAVEVGRENRANYQLIAKALARIGNAYRKKGDMEECLKYLNKSLSDYRNPAVAKTIQEVQKIKAEQERLARINPEKSLEEKGIGNDYFKNGDYPNALKHYSEAIACNPEDAKIYSNRAACYTKLVRFDLALRDCDTCIRLDPKFIKGYLRKGQVHLAMKEDERAVEAFQRALNIDPECREALEGYKKAMVENNKDPDAVRKRAMADPEIQAIMGDPAMRMILQQMEKDPRAAREHLSNPEIAKKIDKLIGSGLLKIA